MPMSSAQITRHGSSTCQRWNLLLLMVLLAGGCGNIQLAQAEKVTISGPFEVRLGEAAQYSASVWNAAIPPVVWSVNGVAGGTSVTGLISAAGLYSPASTFAAGGTVTIRVVAAQQPSSSASRIVTILNPLPALASGSVTQATPGTSFLLDVLGSGFVPASQLQIGSANIVTTFISSTELQGTITLPAGTTTTIRVGVYNPNAAQTSPVSLTLQSIPFVSLTQAARLLDQTSFGPTLSAIKHLRQIGTKAYLNEQFNAPTTRMPAIPSSYVVTCPDATYRCAQSSFWKNALTANDQLRQRVAFALSEIFVVSTDMVNARSIPSYHNMLADDAFGNFRQVMKDVALSPAMGAYLNMLNSGAPPAGEIANENFAREFMQLFTTGLSLLNADGTLQFDAQGLPQPVYTQAQVQAYARALTGWTYASATGGVPTSFPNGVPNFDQPMQPIEVAHEMSAKALLGGVTLPAGQTAEQDLEGVIDSIFNHPNIGPFVGRQLIQHLVTGNPSTGYVGRVAAVFADDGSGVRADMKAVLTAILNDPEARAADTAATAEGGHLREPILYFTGILRALEFTNVDPQGRYDIASSYTAPLGQVPYAASSVFNFFPPSYVIPGTAINAPEFAQENTAAVTLRLTLADRIVRNHLTSFSIDMSQSSSLGQIASATGDAATDSANLVEALNVLFMHDQMPPAMQSTIATHVAQTADIGQRVRVAAWLVFSSNFYKIEH